MPRHEEGRRVVRGLACAPAELGWMANPLVHGVNPVATDRRPGRGGEELAGGPEGGCRAGLRGGLRGGAEGRG